MNFLALIPARYSSSRFPGKPLALIGGKPMIQHVWERASGVFGDCFVATDDRRIAEAVENFGGRVIMTRDDHRSGTDRCAEALVKASEMTGKQFHAVINIQGDEPFIDASHLRSLAALFDDPKTEIGTLVRVFGQGEDITDPNTPKVVMDRNGFALYFSRSPIPYVREKEAPAVFYKHIGLYGYRAEVLLAVSGMPPGVLEGAESLEQLRWQENGLRIKTAVIEGDTLAVDTPEDLVRVNAYFDSLAG